MTYATDIKLARQTVVRDALNNGALDLLGPGGSTILATFALDATSGAVTGEGLLTLAGFPKAVAALVASSYATPVTSGRLKRQNTNPVKTGLTVGLKATAAPAWAASTTYAIGDTRTNGANQYRVTAQTGPSAGSGGPTGTGASITDGGVTWAYLAPANAAIQLSSMVWGVGDTVSVDVNPTLLHA